ncbi:YdeI/OmpD-associated family protein [Roseibium sp. M-1]
MITEVEDFFSKGCGRCSRFDTPDCATRHWAEGLAVLRDLCREAGLEETVKWAHPCYVHDGRNIALIAAFRDDIRLTFFNASLMKDPEGVLEKNGPNTQHPGILRFTDNREVARNAPLIQAYLAEAKGYAVAGIKPQKVQAEFDLPEELIDALDGDPELAEAFHDLTPGRQRSYVINLNGAKTPATRVNRIGKFREKILAGKGATER